MGQFSWYNLLYNPTYSSLPVNWNKIQFCFCKQILSIGVQYVYKRCAGVFLSLDELIWWFNGCFIVGYAWLLGCQVEKKCFRSSNGRGTPYSVLHARHLNHAVWCSPAVFIELTCSSLIRVYDQRVVSCPFLLNYATQDYKNVLY